ncbi:conserved hypothetical protein [Ricinus communis]|uniref:Uncharacterized protein n=1 Tax=Ricinus communis TaxID=3988 RepID=B9S9A7_RICCO|nr:conserved hypothetical protein [Ricinus communis]
MEEISKVKEILEEYQIVSGQLFNFAKYGIVLANSDPFGIRIPIASILGVGCIRDNDKYLGTPALWGRNKAKALNYVKDKMEVKVGSM